MKCQEHDRKEWDAAWEKKTTFMTVPLKNGIGNRRQLTPLGIYVHYVFLLNHKQ